MTIRRIIAAAAVAGTLAVLPISVIANSAEIAGGQGNWPQKTSIKV